MITGTVFTDTSYFQVGLDMSYPHKWVAFRAADGTFCDPLFRHNLANAKRLHDAKRIAGATVYLVYRPGKIHSCVELVKSVIRAELGSLPRWITFMIDAESWGGIGYSNRSADLNQMASLLAAYTGDLRRVLGYGNRSDLDAMWRSPIKGLHLVLASYGSQIRSYPGMVAQQYTDGQGKWGYPAGLPISTRPFGHCDHNIFPGRSPAQVAALLGVLDAPAKPKPKPVVFKPKPTPAPTGDEFTMATGLSPQSKKDVVDIVEARLQHWMPRVVETIRHGVVNAAFPRKVGYGFPNLYAGVIDGVGVDGAVKAAAGTGYFYAQADPKTHRPAGAVYMLVGDKKYKVRSAAEHKAMNPAQVVHALDHGHPLLAIPNL